MENTYRAICRRWVQEIICAQEDDEATMTCLISALDTLKLSSIFLRT